MLILSRRNGESFIIGEDIKITVLSQRSNQVRIGIEAPRSLPIHREEVLLRQANQEVIIENISQSSDDKAPSTAETTPTSQSATKQPTETARSHPKAVVLED